MTDDKKTDSVRVRGQRGAGQCADAAVRDAWHQSLISISEIQLSHSSRCEVTPRLALP